MPEQSHDGTFTFRIINPKIPIFFEFPRNPGKITYKVSKLYQESRQLEGFVFEHWGKKPATLIVEGRLLKTSDVEETGFIDTPVNLDILKLKQLYELDKRKMTSILSTLASATQAQKVTSIVNNLSDTIIQYKYDIYTGFFTEFEYEESAESPYHNDYRFTFVVTNTLEDLLRDSIIKLGNTSTLAGIGSSAILGLGISNLT